VPESPLRALLEQRGLGGRKVVCYVGSIGLDKGIGEAVSFMPHWPDGAVLVLIGSCSATVKERILELAGSANATERVLFLGQKPHPEAMALVAGADVGIALIQPTKRNSVLSAGAVNKRFEYMSIGLPQVTNSGPGVSELVEKTGCGVCVNPNSPDEIGQAIVRLLNDDEGRRRMSKNGRRWHLEEFHYERQFGPVLNWIETAIRETAAAG
jgi:glycosyltransferase involved in cell wall biosynthesis